MLRASIKATEIVAAEATGVGEASYDKNAGKSKHHLSNLGNKVNKFEFKKFRYNWKIP